ncbi:hypothetical protein E2C01_079196 [Portunus trituberculatus]|uniref:Uncharacterized protein n=1 Tax=Portunus trituberculatus TaxID=210409 RepID=A0A5B7IUX3_PORTR|nr:hypothetical protein [Portunus trituberculatus]
MPLFTHSCSTTTMNHDMKEERMSPVLLGGMCPDGSHLPSSEEPRDLSIKRKSSLIEFCQRNASLLMSSLRIS